MIIDGRNLLRHWTVKKNEIGSSSQDVFEIYITVDLVYSTEKCLKECNGVPTKLPTVLTVAEPKASSSTSCPIFSILSEERMLNDSAKCAGGDIEHRGALHALPPIIRAFNCVTVWKGCNMWLSSKRVWT